MAPTSLLLFILLSLVWSSTPATSASRLGGVAVANEDEVEAAWTWLREILQDNSAYSKEEMDSIKFKLQDKLNEKDSHRELFLGLLESSTSQSFGDACGNHNLCREGLECTDGHAPLGYDRCLPNACLAKSETAVQLTKDLEQFQQVAIEQAGLTQVQLTSALVNAGSLRSFAQSTEFVQLKQAMQINQPNYREQLIQLRQECIDEHAASNSSESLKNNFDNSTIGNVTYMGLHFEIGAITDFSLSYMMATNGNTTEDKNLLRYCVGAEAGGGAELSALFGFTDTATPTNLMNDFSIFGDADIVMIIAMGALMARGLKNTFMYEFTVGGGLGLGVGGGFCYTVEDTRNSTSTIPGV